MMYGNQSPKILLDKRCCMVYYLLRMFWVKRWYFKVFWSISGYFMVFHISGYFTVLQVILWYFRYFWAFWVF